MPTVDHEFDAERKKFKFVICSWRVNDAKSHLNEKEFCELCKQVLDFQNKRKAFGCDYLITDSKLLKMESIDTLIERLNKHRVLTFTGLYAVSLTQEILDLGRGYQLVKPNPYLLSARSSYSLNGRLFRESEELSCFFVLKEELSDSPDSKAMGRLQDGLMAVQILKPVKTLGVIFHGRDVESEIFNFQRVEERPQMIPAEWAQRHTFDQLFIQQLPEMIERVTIAVNGKDVKKKNAITLLQLSLEHLHPLIAGLFSVMGMEALFDSKDRNDFKKKLCDCLGAATLAFPQWDIADTSAPKYTVEELAVEIYTLRSKLAHGADLRAEALDKKHPVDLIKKVQLTPDSEPSAYAMVLSEAAGYLLGQVLQKVL
jgi:hypothetical protein